MIQRRDNKPTIFWRNSPRATADKWLEYRRETCEQSTVEVDKWAMDRLCANGRTPLTTGEVIRFVLGQKGLLPQSQETLYKRLKAFYSWVIENYGGRELPEALSFVWFGRRTKGETRGRRRPGETLASRRNHRKGP